MNPDEIRLVQETFGAVAPASDAVAILFYTRLFELDPSLRVMFPDDLAEQRGKLMHMLAVAVNGLSRLDSIVPAVQALGVRHAGYGVTEAHYDTVGAALLATLAEGLGDAFTPPVKDAWTSAYTLLADTMKSAARQTAPA
ncbi:hemin receptor [Frankia sp. CNm7]|uniref:Hemin receptor n=1 Tax=Frankia nepalensis TaxID=1836974 RepID=A0A937RBK1_9ACTN|nr:globin family protein [Frankia nepalensis]MBL7497104.1 hemin receptor [Frankia nepalensis]MBL7510776.1 hemin receptor [Frankia nepalensis]MBL7521552.1 hemin receptor [Frankia nepalensis]MBL7626787.1 hemin receptor [Frankia nepalensis]